MTVDPPARLVILDIDGLRRDVWLEALQAGRLPHGGRLLGGPDASLGLHFRPVSSAPSITFCCQASIFTGAHPDQHGVVGNQFFDRFGRLSGGAPRHYAFDVGDSLAVDDAVLVFSGETGLANQVLSADTPTLYETAARHGRTSTVVHNMIARGATHWIRPDLLDIARFTKGGGLLGLSARQYDGEMLDKALAHLRRGVPADVLTLYFMGLDHHSHQHGPGAQDEYLTQVLDPLLGRLADELERQRLLQDTLFVVVSDHGQIGVIPDDRHSLRLSFPFDREMGYLFDSLGLDVHDIPGEAPACDAVVASNGGLAHVYLQHQQGRWADPPRFADDVLPVARAFWEAHETGRHAEDLRGALSLVLARDVEHDGWEADYRAVTPGGAVVSLEEFFRLHPDLQMVEAAGRLSRLASAVSGDLLLAANYADGFYFAAPLRGVHGGLHPDDSEAVLSLGWPGAGLEQLAWMRETAAEALERRRQAEDRARESLVDMVTAVTALMGWQTMAGN